MSTKQNQTKSKLSEVAKDLKISNQELSDFISDKFGTVKKPSASITQDELNYILESFSQNNQVDSFNPYFESRNNKPEPKKEEKPADKKPAPAKKQEKPAAKKDTAPKAPQKAAAEAAKPAQPVQTAKPAAPKAAAKPAAPVQQAAPAPVVEEGIPGDVVAAIMAAIHAMGNGKYTLRAVRRGTNGWGKAGVNDTTAPF